ncbi:hypothetical protein LSPH24S_10128 [Lysinibacillus sphaericus]
MGGFGAIGIPGLIIILVIVLLVFGLKKNYRKSVVQSVKHLQSSKSQQKD